MNFLDDARKVGYFILLMLFIIRVVSINWTDLSKNKMTTSDSFGYYMYLPGLFIYDDIKDWEWVEKIESRYHLVGGSGVYQISEHASGNRVTNYQGGIAVMQLPFFLIAHGIAHLTSYPEDGFSAPYQLAIGIAPLVYLWFTLFLLIGVMRHYFDDIVISISLLIVFLATNAPQYLAVDSGQCHGYILSLYIFIIYLTHRWHLRPHKYTALLAGLVIGLAVMCRPTELLMVLIPILWGMQTKESKNKKWSQVRACYSDVLYAALGGLLGVVLQLIYWQIATGFFFHAIGSKWRFLDPYFRVLGGWEKGWFLYTPMSILFVIGLFYVKKYPFRKSVFWFCLVNIWVVISWNNWRYGGSYSTRALVQSYPVFAFALAAVVAQILEKKWKYVLYIASVYFISLNLFQIWQYNQTIIHYDDMNGVYYKAVYWDANPSPLDMSYLDYPHTIPSYIDTCSSTITEVNLGPIHMTTPLPISLPYGPKSIAMNAKNIQNWLDVSMTLLVEKGYWNGNVILQFTDKDLKFIDKHSFRLKNAITEEKARNSYKMQVKIPPKAVSAILLFDQNVEGRIDQLDVNFCTWK